MSDSIRNFTSWAHDMLGVSPVHIEHGELMRFGPKKRCYCKLWPDGLGGFAGDFKNGIFATWSAIDPERMSHSERLAHEARIAQAKVERDREQAARWERNRPRLRSTWDASHKLVMGDPVTLYVKRRVQGGMWPLPACLRYHQALPYWDDGEVLGTFPAMVARFHAADGRCVGLHQTYLTRDGRKADVPTPKKMSPTSGPLIGGCIPLAQPIDGTIGVAEGIETALCAGAGSGLPVVATYSANALAAYQWPKGLRRLVIFADNDVSGTGQAAAAKLERRARAAGLSVSVLLPQTPGEDWADVYARRDAAAVEAVADSLERARFDGLEGGAA